MKIKNISNKPICFGTFGILPDETKDISGVYRKNPVVAMYKKRKFIVIIDEGEDDGGENADNIYAGMSVDNLRKECKERGIKYISKDNKNTLTALLIADDESNTDGENEDGEEPPETDGDENTPDGTGEQGA